MVWGMPGSAVEAGRVLGGAAARPDRAEDRSGMFLGGAAVTPLDYDYLRKLLQGALRPRAVGRQAIPGRKPAAAGRAQERLVQVSADWWPKLKSADAEPLIVEVVEAMTTNESFFFRDKIPFDHFRDTIMPALLRARARERRIRIWCAAASTGQEPYSLAMCLKEMGKRARRLAHRYSSPPTCPPRCWRRPRAGIYSQFEVQRGLPIQMLVKYFSQVGETWQIAPEIRAMVQFQPLNLLDDFSSLGTFDVVFCRNVLIYFDQETKIGVLNRIAR